MGKYYFRNIIVVIWCILILCNTSLLALLTQKDFTDTYNTDSEYRLLQYDTNDKFVKNWIKVDILQYGLHDALIYDKVSKQIVRVKGNLYFTERI